MRKITEESRRAARALAALREHVLDRVSFDLDAAGHVHRPDDLAPVPGRSSSTLFPGEVMAAHLDALVDAQDDDGGWPVDFLSRTPVNGFEWRGFTTVTRLATLRAYGRLR